MSILNVDTINDAAGTGAPDFPNGLTRPTPLTVIAEGASNAASTTVAFQHPEVVDTDNAYNPATGVFTAPSAGKYMLSASSYSGGSFYPRIYINGSFVYEGTQATANTSGQLTLLLNLSSSDTVEVRPSTPVTGSGSTTINYLHIIQVA